MSTAITETGLWVRSGLWRRRRLIRFDDVQEVEGGTLVTRGGERIDLPAAVLDSVRGIVSGPSCEDGWERCREAFGAYLDGPHGSEQAVRYLCEACDRLGATDLHLEPEPDAAHLRMRIAGELCSFAALPARAVPGLVAAAKALAGCLPYRRDVVQEGRIPREGIAADVRASFIPTAFGERLALRFFGRLRRLDDLGLTPDVLATLRAALAARHGLILVAGKTGAGKTTTLYACLAHLAAHRSGAHLSLEDPVEQRLRKAGIPVDQVELCPERGIDGEAMLAASLRQDVDVLAVGELRTADEARLALRAAHTGRLVLAGVHAGSVAQAERRLLDLGLAAERLAESLRLVLYQELASVPCDCGGRDCERCGGLGRRLELLAQTGRHERATPTIVEAVT